MSKIQINPNIGGILTFLVIGKTVGGIKKTLGNQSWGFSLMISYVFFYDSPKVPVTWRMGSQLDPVVRI